MKTRYFIAFTMLTMLSHLAQASGQAMIPRISWAVHPASAHFKRGGPISLRYELKNLSGRFVLVGRSPQIPGEIQLHLTGPDGGSAQWEGAVAEAGPSFEFTVLRPGQSLRGQVLIPLNCDATSFHGGFCLDKAGKYRGTAMYRAPSYSFMKTLGCNGAFITGPYHSVRFDFELE
jgi:hypothetical protein